MSLVILEVKDFVSWCMMSAYASHGFNNEGTSTCTVVLLLHV